MEGNKIEMKLLTEQEQRKKIDALLNTMGGKPSNPLLTLEHCKEITDEYREFPEMLYETNRDHLLRGLLKIVYSSYKSNKEEIEEKKKAIRELTALKIDIRNKTRTLEAKEKELDSKSKRLKENLWAKKMLITLVRECKKNKWLAPSTIRSRYHSIMDEVEKEEDTLDVCEEEEWNI